jgi:hypothetical protein
MGHVDTPRSDVDQRLTEIIPPLSEGTRQLVDALASRGLRIDPNRQPSQLLMYAPTTPGEPRRR